MRVLVCGGRNYRNKLTVWDELHLLAEEHGWLTIIEGGAAGADTLARLWAQEYYHGLVTVRAEWGKYGVIAGGIRNEKMLVSCRPDMGLAFPGGNGTADMIARLRRDNIKLKIVED